MDFFSPSGFKIERDFDHRTSNQVLPCQKCYLNEKNLIHGRVGSTISKFSPHIFLRRTLITSVKSSAL